MKKQFSKPFIAYEGCGCGFVYDDDDELIEDEDDVRRDTLPRESVRQFSEYLSNLVKNGSVELFACWEGDQETEPEGKLIVTSDFFGGDEFGFEQKQFLTVVQN